MSWNKIKKCFKKKPKKDKLIDFRNGGICFKSGDDFLPHNMMLHTKYIKQVEEGLHMYVCNGVMIEATDIIEAQRKYLRMKR